MSRLQQVGCVALCVLLLGCSKQHDDDASAGASPERIPGSLLLLDDFGVPAPAGTKLLVAGEVVTTDEQGRAPLPMLPDRYDVAVLAGGTVYVYEGLATRAPVIRVEDSLALEVHSVKVDVFADQPEGVSLDVLQDLHGPGVDGTSSGFNSERGHYWVTMRWVGAEDATLSLQVLTSEIDPETRLTTRYTGYAQLERSVHDGDEVSWSPELSALPYKEKTIHVETQLPPEHYIFQHSLLARTKHGTVGVLGTGDNAVTADLLVPDLPGVTFHVSSDTDGPLGFSSAMAHDVSPGERVRLTVGLPPESLTPEDEAQGVSTETEFSWTGVDDAIYYMFMFPTGSLGAFQYEYKIATPNLRTTLPDLTPLGIGAPQGEFSWRPNAVTGVRSVDDYAAVSGRQESWSYGETRHFRSGELTPDPSFEAQRRLAPSQRLP